MSTSTTTLDPSNDNHQWKVKFMNLGSQIYSPFADPRIETYLQSFPEGSILQATQYSELKDTVLVQNMTDTQFADFCAGLTRQKMEIEITKLF